MPSMASCIHTRRLLQPLTGDSIVRFGARTKLHVSFTLPWLIVCFDWAQLTSGCRASGNRWWRSTSVAENDVKRRMKWILTTDQLSASLTAKDSADDLISNEEANYMKPNWQPNNRLTVKYQTDRISIYMAASCLTVIFLANQQLSIYMAVINHCNNQRFKWQPDSKHCHIQMAFLHLTDTDQTDWHMSNSWVTVTDTLTDRRLTHNWQPRIKVTTL